MKIGLRDSQTIQGGHATNCLWLCLLVSLCLESLFGPPFVPNSKADNLYARIQGTIADPTGALLAGVRVIATNVSTGISYSTESNGDGDFVLLNLPIGTYTVTAAVAGFRKFTVSNVTLALDQVYVLNLKMQLGSETEAITVKANTVQVETANTQLGTVIDGSTIEDMPLITRDWLQLQTLEPGVMSSSDRFGTYSTNGSQTQQNSFLIEGQDSNDFQANTPLIRPSVDAITEFDMVTNTINPEYGRNSGAILNATIKSGTNNFHGDGFEFYRDTFLNSCDYLTGQKPIYHQNEFGGTVGGPIRKNRTFFFFSYQGQRYREPQPSSTQTVYSAAERNGEFNQGPDVDQATGEPFVAESQDVAPIELWGDSASPCPVGGAECPANSTTYARLFSTGVIPEQDLNPIAVKLVNQYVPPPNGSDNAYNFNAVTAGTDNQYLFKIDQALGTKDSLRFYGLFESNPDAQTLSYFGGTLPGFPQVDTKRYKQFVAGWTRVFSPNAVNEFRVGYTRSNLAVVEPEKVVLPASYGFNIDPNIASLASLPYISVVGTQPGQVSFSIGFSQQGPQPRVNQTYQLDDNFSKVWRGHTSKVGYDERKFVVTNPRGYLNNGSFSFGGIGTFSTGNAAADFLLGIPDSYSQSSGGTIDPYAYEHYLYAEDSWKARTSLTLNYGLGWQINTPVTNNFNNKRAIACFRPGQQSTVYPTAPEDMVFPGDKGCSASGYYTGYKHFGPRVGFAWSPHSKSAPGDLGGRPGQFSIRGGFGIYYNQVEEELTLQDLLTPPFGIVDFGVGDIGLSPSFANPWVDIAGRGSITDKYPFTPPPAGSNVDFTFFEPMSINVIDPKFGAPYSMNYNTTLQREIPGQIILSLDYVGAQGRHLERAYDLNEARPGACAAIPTCINSSGNRLFQGYYFPQNFPYAAVIPGTTSLVFGGVGQESTDGNSNYNALQVSLNKRTSHGLSFLLSYNYAHSRDDGSSFENSIGGVTSTSPRGTNPFYNNLNWGDSQFDARQRLVASYIYEIRVPHTLNSNAFTTRVLQGWAISGFTTLQTGFPINIGNTAYTSGTCWVYTYYGCADNGNQLGPIMKQDPRSSSRHYYFNPSAFALPTLGTFGNVGRNSFHGPGQNFTNFALLKDIGIREPIKIQLRLEAQNVFNHVNFDLPVANINSSQFGEVLSDSLGPRLVQLGAKLYF